MSVFLGIEWNTIQDYIFFPQEDFVYPDFGQNFSGFPPKLIEVKYNYKLK